MKESFNELLQTTLRIFNLARGYNEGYIEGIWKKQEEYYKTFCRREQELSSFLFQRLTALFLTFILLVVFYQFHPFDHSLLVLVLASVNCAGFIVFQYRRRKRKMDEQNRIDSKAVPWETVQGFKRVWSLMKQVYPGLVAACPLGSLKPEVVRKRIEEQTRWAVKQIKIGNGNEPVPSCDDMDVCQYYKQLINLSVRLNLFGSENFSVTEDDKEEEFVYAAKARMLQAKMFSEDGVVSDAQT